MSNSTTHIMLHVSSAVREKTRLFMYVQVNIPAKKTQLTLDHILSLEGEALGVFNIGVPRSPDPTKNDIRTDYRHVCIPSCYLPTRAASVRV